MKTIELTINDVLTTLTIDDVWNYCVSMWDCISKQEGDIDELKEKWLKERGFDPDKVSFQCFFCEWGRVHKPVLRSIRCLGCPARDIDPDFECCGISKYHYFKSPKKFRNKVAHLHRKRNKAKQSA